MSDYWIRASEVGDYLYCRRSWWLKRSRGIAPENVRELARGSQHHRQHSNLVSQSIWLRRAAYVLIFVVVAVMAYSLVGG